MSISSMTAYARAAVSSEYGEFEWQLRSVNHRYLDLSLRLPDSLRSLEPQVREAATRVLRRGKVDLTLRHTPPADAVDATLDENVLETFLGAARRIAERLDAPPAAPDPYVILRLPGVLRPPSGPDADALGSTALELLGRALDELADTRRREGARLAGLIHERIVAAHEEVQRVRTRLPALVDSYRERLRERVSALGVSVDATRLEQEVVLLVQRGDPAEELDRLELHLEEVERTLAQDTTVGRRLDFLMQELTREANTLGSKAGDMEVTQAAVALKVLIEQMREQIQNIE